MLLLQFCSASASLPCSTILTPPPPPPHTHSESSIDNILAPLGEQVKREVLRGSQGPGEGQGQGEEASADDLNDSALWAYDDAPPLP